MYHKPKKKGRIYGFRSFTYGKGARQRQRNDRTYRAFHHTEERRPHTHAPKLQAIEYPDGVKDRSAAVQRRLEEAGLTRKIESNQVRAIRINVSGTHEDMKRIEEEGRLDEWCADNMKYFADTLVPIVKGERKSRKREEQTKEAEHKKEVSRLTRLVEKLCAWFPLAKEVLRVEKLCAIVGFSMEQTRTLIADREVTHDSTLYSEEHGRSFTARNVTAKIRQESVSKRLVLYINQTPVSEWFKEQFERLKQSMRQPIQP